MSERLLVPHPSWCGVTECRADRDAADNTLYVVHRKTVLDDGPGRVVQVHSTTVLNAADMTMVIADQASLRAEIENLTPEQAMASAVALCAAAGKPVLR